MEDRDALIDGETVRHVPRPTEDRSWIGPCPALGTLHVDGGVLHGLPCDLWRGHIGEHVSTLSFRWGAS